MFKWRRRKGYSQLGWYKFTMTWSPFCVSDVQLKFPQWYLSITKTSNPRHMGHAEKAGGAGNSSIKLNLNHHKSAWWITWHEVVLTYESHQHHAINHHHGWKEISLIANLNSPSPVFTTGSLHLRWIFRGFLPPSKRFTKPHTNELKPPPPPPRGDVGLPEMGGTGRFGFTLK